MFETTNEIELFGGFHTLNIKTVENADREQRKHFAYSDRRDCFIPISRKLYGLLERNSYFTRLVEEALDIEEARYACNLEDAHWDTVYERRKEQGLLR